MTTFTMGFLHIVMSDNTISYESEFGNIQKTQQAMEYQISLDQQFSTINLFIMMLHLFWFLFGSINILPVIFIEGLYMRKDLLTINNCEAPVHFWFSFLCLCLQWFLLVVVAIWYKVETNFWGQDFRLNSSTSTEVKNTNQENQQEICQYHSFPKPTLY
jgi:hypothetical protein